MAATFRTYAFTLPTSNDSSWDCVVPSWTETPNAVIVQWVKNSGAGTAAQGKISYGFGAYDGSSTYTNGCLAGMSEDSSAKQDCSQYISNARCLWTYADTATGNLGNEAYNSTLELNGVQQGGVTFNYRHGASANNGGQTIVVTFIVADNAYVGNETGLWSSSGATTTAPDDDHNPISLPT